MRFSRAAAAEPIFMAGSAPPFKTENRIISGNALG